MADYDAVAEEYSRALDPDGSGPDLRGRGWFVFSIVHPAFHNHVEIVDDYLVDHSYAKFSPPTWLPPRAHHRPLSMVVNELASAGLLIERMVEVHWRPEDAGGVPGLLYARAVKSDADTSGDCPLTCPD